MEPFALKKTGDSDYPRHLKIVALGPAKSGKTSLIATAPNVVIADVEAGLMSIAHLNIPYVTVDDPSKLSTLITILKDDALRAKAAQQLGLPKIETVALDTADAFQELLKRQRMRDEKRSKFERDDWGWLLDQMREALKALFALPLHVVVSVHTKTTQDDENRIITLPGLQGAIAEEIAGYPDFVVMTQRDPEVDGHGNRYMKYRLKVEGDSKNLHLGNRAAGRLPEYVDSDFKVLHAAVFQGIDLSQEPAAAPVIHVETLVETEAQAETVLKAVQTPDQPVPAPPSDEELPITEAGVKHLTKFYAEFGYQLPDLTGWTLGRAREIARMFVAVGSDVAEGKATAEEMATYLQGIEGAWAGPAQAAPPKKAPARKKKVEGEAPATPATPVAPAVEAVEAPAPVAPAAPVAPVAPVTPPAAAADVNTETPAPAPVAPAPVGEAEPEVTEQEAIATVQSQLGGSVIETLEATVDTCAVGGCAIDDPDIAKLALSRWGKAACVTHYLELLKSPE